MKKDRPKPYGHSKKGPTKAEESVQLLALIFILTDYIGSPWHRIKRNVAKTC